MTAAINPEETPSPQQGRKRVRIAVSVIGPLVIIALFAYLLAAHGSEVSAAASRMSLGGLLVVTLMALITLLARTEAVVACLAAMGSPPRRSDIHAANSLTMLAATLNHYLSSVLRAALVRRIDPERAPTIAQMVLIDTSTFLIEGVLVTFVIIISAGALKIAWWVPATLLVVAAVAFTTLITARRRFERHPVVRGLDVLAHSRQRVVVAALMTIVIGLQIVRTLIVLDGVGLHASLLQASATFVAGGALSTLFAGPGAGAAGGPLLVFGHKSLAAATAAGLVLSISALLAGMLYSLLGGPLFVWRWRHQDT